MHSSRPQTSPRNTSIQLRRITLFAVKSRSMTTQDFLEANEALQDDWFGSYGNPDIAFIYDGATDPERWFSSPWRIMCLLKEAHGGGQWDHAGAILKDNGLLRVGGTANQSVHYRMIEWIYATEATLMGMPCDIEEDRSLGYPRARQAMLRSAWVNIKKANGVPYSDGGNLYVVARRDAAFLRRQIALLDPRVVLCGYTFGIVREVLFPDAEKINGTEFSYFTPEGRIILDYYHPGRKSRDSYKPLTVEVERIRAARVLVPNQALNGEPLGAGAAGLRQSVIPESAARRA